MTISAAPLPGGADMRRLTQLDWLAILVNMAVFVFVWPAATAFAQALSPIDDLTTIDAQVVRVVFAGALGGFVRWLALREQWRAGIVSILVGSISAAYLGPLTLPILNPVLGDIVADGAALANLNGFVTGLFGVGLTGYLIDILRKRTVDLRHDQKRPPGTGESGGDGSN